MKLRSSEDDEKDLAINLTAMIDTFMLLLIFFMLATNFVQIEKEMDVSLPSSDSGQLATQVPDELIINVRKDGSLVVSGNPVDEEALQSTLARLAEHDAKTPVTIRGDKDVRHARIVSVMDACGVVGLTNLQIGTIEEGG